jgi:methylated-DNA-[protein]-cysteine S-methyltransferase
MPRFLIDRIETPLGLMVLIADQGKVLLLEFEDATDRVSREMNSRFKASGDAVVEPNNNPFGLSDKIRAYFNGNRAIIEDIATDGGGTEFERKVWRELRAIPCGTTISYGELARRLGNPNLMRAVGLANGKNPIAVIVPCHRVIGADGKLTGYGGGLHRKEWLLRHEGALLV